MENHFIHSINTCEPVDSEMVMNTRQPDSITIDGVELPTMKKVFVIQNKLERQARQREVLIVILVILMLAELLVLVVK